MAHSIATGTEGAFPDRIQGQTASRTSSPTNQAYQILHLAFVVAPLVAGLDKFFHLLVNWECISRRRSQTFRQSAGTD
jgi:hypothetical protein